LSTILSYSTRAISSCDTTKYPSL